MSYMTMEEQIASHLTFLKNQNLAVEKLEIDGGFVRCCFLDRTTGRGELCYQTKKNQLNNGMVGLATWCRISGGQTNTHRTYGLPFPVHNAKVNVLDATDVIDALEELRKADVFWRMSDQVGEAEYVRRKGVGYYGIRFRQTNHGKIAVVPMRDIDGKFSSYQLINADGTKRFCRNIEIKGLLHMLHTPIEKFTIGLAESYTTAATCYELTGMPMVTAFSSDNLMQVAVKIRKKFPNNPIIIFGDNDRHLQTNKGAQAAYAVKKELGKTCSVAIPDFSNCPVNREFSDWNDFVRESGVKETRDAISKALNEV
jgi:phage/plasmid primase-like uncharacterized protein